MLSFLLWILVQKEKLDQFSSIFLFYLWKYGTTHFTINNSWQLIPLLFIISLTLKSTIYVWDPFFRYWNDINNDT